MLCNIRIDQDNVYLDDIKQDNVYLDDIEIILSNQEIINSLSKYEKNNEDLFKKPLLNDSIHYSKYKKEILNLFEQRLQYNLLIYYFLPIIILLLCYIFEWISSYEYYNIYNIIYSIFSLICIIYFIYDDTPFLSVITKFIFYIILLLWNIYGLIYNEQNTNNLSKKYIDDFLESYFMLYIKRFCENFLNIIKLLMTNSILLPLNYVENIQTSVKQIIDSPIVKFTQTGIKSVINTVTSVLSNNKNIKEISEETNSIEKSIKITEVFLEKLDNCNTIIIEKINETKNLISNFICSILFFISFMNYMWIIILDISCYFNARNEIIRSCMKNIKINFFHFLKKLLNEYKYEKEKEFNYDNKA